MSFFNDYFSGLAGLFNSVDPDDLLAATDLIDASSARGGKIVLVGNGGSAAIASHTAVDLTNAAGRRALTFHDPGLITCLANDYGYSQWVAKALDSYANEGDAAILISSSGQSENILNGAERASKIGLSVLTLSGFRASNPLRSMGDVNLWADSSTYNSVEITHQVWLLAIIDCLIERDRASTDCP